jgi:hypothetical protein
MLSVLEPKVSGNLKITTITAIYEINLTISYLYYF